jgi:DNA-binding XRE family transcriptional regulator
MVRRAHEPTDRDRKQVTLMAGIGLTHDQIAKVIGISDETLRKYYDEELSTAASKMNAQVAQNLFSIATSKGAGAVASAIFWMKTRGGWREVERKEITGPDGGPIKTESKIDISGLDLEELEALEKALTKTGLA